VQRILFTALLAVSFAAAQIPDFKPPTPLFAAVLRNDAPAVAKLLENGADPNEGRFFGFPALVLAVINGNEPMALVMLAAGADAKATDRNGANALMWAAGGERPNARLVSDLLKRGVDANVQNNSGESALTWAMRRGDMEMAARLEEGGASNAAAIRKAVESAVAMLQKSGPQFVKVSGCVSCHHQSVPQMAYAAARERGMRVAGDVSAQQVTAVMAMFKPIREGMEKGTVNLPNPGISVSYSLLGVAAEGYAADETTAAMAMAIARTQLPEGSFAVLPARPPIEASGFTSTALSIRALQLYGRGMEGRVEAAARWLRNAAPLTNEDRTMKLLGLSWAGANVETAAADLLAQQRPDGGWAQLAGLESDAYATGQAMVALREAGVVKPSDGPYKHGIAYLLRTQLPDGTWHVRTRSSPVQQFKESGFPHGRDQWISAAATGWAAWALALSQPKIAAVSSEGF